MTEHVCEWEVVWREDGRPEWMSKKRDAVLSPNEITARLNATERLSAEDARGAIPQQINKRMADALQAYADILEGK